MIQCDLSSGSEDAARLIADETARWVRQEALTSLDDRNAYLDMLDTARGWLEMDYDDPANFLAVKHAGHANRQRFWGEALTLEPQNDEVTGRHIFNTLMQISGIGKRMCYFAAADQAHYLQLKRSETLPGIDAFPVALGRIAAARVIEASGERTVIQAPDAAESQAATLRQFAELGLELNDLLEATPDDFGKPESPTMDHLRTMQQKWVGLVTGHVLTALAYRGGDLSQVPFLEPKSISDEPQVYYPFQQTR